tara:strand:+ start:2257 stop:3684 length:1428 start_codon:yes stop_codon:yes gene_type:complete
MVFTSPTFLFGFLPLTLVFYFLSPKSVKNLILLGMSLLFYAWGEFTYLLVMIASITVNYSVGIWLDYSNQKKKVLLVGVGLNLVILLHFKYLSFLIENWNKFIGTDHGLSLTPPDIHLPLGISFFTFQAISYLVDVYRNDAKVQKNIFHLALYLSLFPQLIAGPIVRFSDVTDQIESRAHKLSDFSLGIERFIFGLSKKMWLANPMGELSDLIFQLSSDERTLPIAWIGIIAYGLQIYFDFSGYSDMAIGLGKMFGFHFLENFNYPYISRSIREFWRRWHISLSTWFRDYLYIPLGGSRVRSSRIYFNLFCVFVVTGFWHGASWNFLIWGLFHGTFLALEHAGGYKLLNKLPGVIQHSYTITIVLIGWVFFRSESLNGSILYLSDMFNFNNIWTNQFQILSIFSKEFMLIGTISLFIAFPTFNLLKHLIRNNFKRIGINYELAKLSKMFFLLCLFCFCVLKIASSTYNPFIYFRF